VYGSKHSLLPRIWAVDAVGIGASSSELRTPCSLIRARSAFQSQRADGSTQSWSTGRFAFHIGLASSPDQQSELLIAAETGNLFEVGPMSKPLTDPGRFSKIVDELNHITGLIDLLVAPAQLDEHEARQGE